LGLTNLKVLLVLFVSTAGAVNERLGFWLVVLEERTTINQLQNNSTIYFEDDF
jgi:hypothetical protein